MEGPYFAAKHIYQQSMSKKFSCASAKGKMKKKIKNLLLPPKIIF